MPPAQAERNDAVDDEQGDLVGADERALFIPCVSVTARLKMIERKRPAELTTGLFRR